MLLGRQIELERRRLNELHETGKKISDKIKSGRKKNGGVNAAQESNWSVQKQIKILENRLEKCNHKYNEAITKNKDLREHINNLRRERLVYDSIYKKLEKDLQEKKKEMAGIIDICNAAYEARDAVGHPGWLIQLWRDLLSGDIYSPSVYSHPISSLASRIDKARDLYLPAPAWPPEAAWAALGCPRTDWLHPPGANRQSMRWHSSRPMRTRSRQPARRSGEASAPSSMRIASRRWACLLLGQGSTGGEGGQSRDTKRSQRSQGRH